MFALIAGLSFLVARFLPVLSFHYACPFKAAVGIPCPTCGMTRAFVHLAHGDVGAAFAASPAGALLAAAAWAYAALDLVRALAGAPLPVPSVRALRAATAAGIALALASWTFVLLTEAR